jgi:MOSC domain-containing protein YiiM
LKTAGRHNNVYIGAYASVIQAGQVRIGDAVSIV